MQESIVSGGVFDDLSIAVKFLFPLILYFTNVPRKTHCCHSDGAYDGDCHHPDTFGKVSFLEGKTAQQEDRDCEHLEYPRNDSLLYSCNSSHHIFRRSSFLWRGVGSDVARRRLFGTISLPEFFRVNKFVRRTMD